MEQNNSSIPRVPPIWIRFTHWSLTFSFFALLFSGFIILMCHPRLYWGEVGNDLTPAILEFPISRNHQHGGWDQVQAFTADPDGPYSASRTFEIFNQNGWGRSLHFLAAWILVATGLVYLCIGLVSGHLWRRIWPKSADLKPSLLWADFKHHIRRNFPKKSGWDPYGHLQKWAYWSVIFILFPVIIMTGLTMSPAVTAAYPFLLDLFFGAQSARTIHFFASSALVLFLLTHLIMVVRSGFRKNLGTITLGK